jgi:hypothetical protein
MDLERIKEKERFALGYVTPLSGVVSLPTQRVGLQYHRSPSGKSMQDVPYLW